MKKILITGANSYVGTSFEKYLKEKFPNVYIVDTIDMVGDGWREKSFIGYDAVFHVAGIVHQKETKKNARLYYEVNRDLAFNVAKQAKDGGVSQFIFLSSMSVYGQETGIITKATMPKPKTNYGKSKLQAEEMILKLSDENFKICILRPPMVYGEGCKGNYRTVVKIVRNFSIFPRIKNKKSLIHIDNLVSFVKMSVDLNLNGIYFPQNNEYVGTMELVKQIARNLKKRIYFSYLCGIAVLILKIFSRKARKAFGNLIYKDTEDFEFMYCKRVV